MELSKTRGASIRCNAQAMWPGCSSNQIRRRTHAAAGGVILPHSVNSLSAWLAARSMLPREAQPARKLKHKDSAHVHFAAGFMQCKTLRRTA